MAPEVKNDVFISYARADAEAAEEVARFLRDAGLKVWLDIWSLVPGESWRASLERALENVSSVAIFVGPSGLARSQEQELAIVLGRQPTGKPARIIPVLLPGSDVKDSPLNLREYAGVDLRDMRKEPERFYQLVAMLKGGNAETAQLAMA